MREIKFRAWCTDENTMYENVTYNKDYESGVNPWIFMQFTGLLDKNGKEIYEGDVLHQDNYSDWIVEWKSPGFSIYNQCNPQTYFPLVDSGREVNGNIYENPELIK